MIDELRARALTHGDFSIAILLNRSADRIETLERALREAVLQLEYLDERSPTGTTPAIIAKINHILPLDASDK